ncbi:hypothetical protein EFY79_18320 [Hanamia caeni]|jgi:hypothetical protein|uniref:Apea-like HEPN domain-containing protein n=1 Tax=Hanamia caeni TaxID=2294116 RepID=A0A3M9N9E4_9BACT|nr:hypothetical protein [Hanamia caeni]RNI33578.1 hypothetical protein EFY79_18320 [Hanamia caeni]
MEELGCYYFHIFYPSHIYINQKSPFDFEFEDYNYSVIIIKTLRSLITNDFNNKIVGHTDNEGLRHHELIKKEIDLGKGSLVIEFTDGNIAYALDNRKHLYTEFYTKDYTEIVLLFESTKKADNISIARKALDYFIDCYRHVSGDVLTLSITKTTYVSIVTKEYFYIYSEDELKLPKEDRNKISREFKLGVKQMTLPFWGTQGKRLQSDETKIAADLTDFFKKKSKTNSLQEFLLRAREELNVHKNYKYAFIETWTSLEVAIVSYLRKAKLAKGISKNKIDDFESQVGISYLLNIELPLIHKTNDENFKIFIRKVDAIRKLRNKVIHQNKDITPTEAENAYQITLEFLNYMGILKIFPAVVGVPASNDLGK